MAICAARRSQTNLFKIYGVLIDRNILSSPCIIAARNICSDLGFFYGDCVTISMAAFSIIVSACDIVSDVKGFSPGTAIDDGDGIIVCTSCSILTNNASGNKTFDFKARVCLTCLHSHNRFIILNGNGNIIVISADCSCSLVVSAANVTVINNVTVLHLESLHMGIRNGDRIAVGVPFFAIITGNSTINITATNVSLDGTTRNGYHILPGVSALLISSPGNIAHNFGLPETNHVLFNTFTLQRASSRNCHGRLKLVTLSG